MDIKIIKDLLNRYLAGHASAAEKKLVEDWLDENDLPGNKWNEMPAEQRAMWMIGLQDDILKSIDKSSSNDDVKNVISLPWYRRLYIQLAAAAVIIAIAGSWYFALRGAKLPASAIVSITHKADTIITPGSNKAVLTLSDGNTVELSDTANGVVTKQGNTEISKSGAQLVYNESVKPANSGNISYNTLSTPRGGQYKLVLPDGSEVWLNAASSIRYPVAFVNDMREVEIKGEAYFEIKPQWKDGRKIPFVVQVLAGDGTRKNAIEVLGTHFNINAYDEESSINTTLITGKVKVTAENHSGAEAILAPGQQAQLNARGNIKVLNDVDIDETIAWKNGLFMMNKADITVILRQLSRWYDVDIVYANGIPQGKISGDIPRTMQLADVLKVMKLSGIKFSIEGKKIIVEPG
ncbi:MAG: DUF4974 domain-containing protein [Agriterribacter sp.]